LVSSWQAVVGNGLARWCAVVERVAYVQSFDDSACWRWVWVGSVKVNV
jgi:hypothetical protein